jgi:hypothetical protein
LDKKELTKILHKNYHGIFKETYKNNGFKKYKTNDYINMTEDNIIQMITIQKHSFKTEFTFNIAIFPLFIKTDFFYFAFGGIRIGDFIKGNDFWWDYSNEYILKESLNNSLNIIQNKIFPFFHSINNSNKLLKHLNSKNCMFKGYKHNKNNHHNDIGLLYLKNGEKSNANKYLNNETKNEITKYRTEEEYLNNIIITNMEKYKI